MAAVKKCEAAITDRATRRTVQRCTEPGVVEVTRGLSGIKQLLCESHAKGARGTKRRVGGW